MSNTPKIMSLDNDGDYYAIIGKSDSSSTTGSVDKGWYASAGRSKQTSSSGVHVPKQDDDVMVLGTVAGSFSIYTTGSSDDWSVHIHNASGEVQSSTPSGLPDNQHLELEVASDGTPSFTIG